MAAGDHFTFQIDIISILFWDFTYPTVNMSFIKTVDLSGCAKEDREELRACRRVRVVKSSVLWRDFYIFSFFIVRGTLGMNITLLPSFVFSVFPSILRTVSWFISSVLKAACLAGFCIYENCFLSY